MLSIIAFNIKSVNILNKSINSLRYLVEATVNGNEFQAILTLAERIDRIFTYRTSIFNHR